MTHDERLAALEMMVGSMSARLDSLEARIGDQSADLDNLLRWVSATANAVVMSRDAVAMLMVRSLTEDMQRRRKDSFAYAEYVRDSLKLLVKALDDKPRSTSPDQPGTADE